MNSLCPFPTWDSAFPESNLFDIIPTSQTPDLVPDLSSMEGSEVDFGATSETASLYGFDYADASMPSNMDMVNANVLHDRDVEAIFGASGAFPFYNASCMHSAYGEMNASPIGFDASRHSRTVSLPLESFDAFGVKQHSRVLSMPFYNTQMDHPRVPVPLNAIKTHPLYPLWAELSRTHHAATQPWSLNNHTNLRSRLEETVQMALVTLSQFDAGAYGDDDYVHQHVMELVDMVQNLATSLPLGIQQVPGSFVRRASYPGDMVAVPSPNLASPHSPSTVSSPSNHSVHLMHSPEADLGELSDSSYTSSIPSTPKRAKPMSRRRDPDDLSSKHHEPRDASPIKKTRENYNKKITSILMNWYFMHNGSSPDPKTKEELASQTGLTSAKVATWYQNARRRYQDKLEHFTTLRKRIPDIVYDHESYEAYIKVQNSENARKRKNTKRSKL
ncbi:hypothetical protein BZG36_03328 [Bifiguratus adelaidae]|uniref:Homeobox domain-containing protein n=1 Tax=Bifiguratus adelaidae TaxID=1938954 RepID=A0A261XY68_9FUNG|nr:hypothetical protein BZG36_03328 [Bifiguratus adelaidae]